MSTGISYVLVKFKKFIYLGSLSEKIYLSQYRQIYLLAEQKESVFIRNFQREIKKNIDRF